MRRPRKEAAVAAAKLDASNRLAAAGQTGGQDAKMEQSESSEAEGLQSVQLPSARAAASKKKRKNTNEQRQHQQPWKHRLRGKTSLGRADGPSLPSRPSSSLAVDTAVRDSSLEDGLSVVDRARNLSPPRSEAGAKEYDQHSPVTRR